MTTAGLAFDAPWLLVLLPLAAVPLWVRRDAAASCGWLAWAPRDRMSVAADAALRGTAVLALAALVVALSGPYRPEAPVQAVGEGAEVMLLLDRSRSMDQGFAGRAEGPAPTGTGPEALAYYARKQQARGRESKGQVARTLLAEFATRRPKDRFGMVIFSSLPMRVLDFTQKPEAIQAAIAAGQIGRGIADTDIGIALQAALETFEGRPYTGSRLVLLVSDGGDHIEPDMRTHIEDLVRRHRVAIYWIYLRSANSPGLMKDASDDSIAADTVPEHFLHRWFESLDTRYRAYEAEDGDALQAAIDDVDRLEKLPITYIDTLPRRDLSGWAYGAAALAVLGLLGANLMELRRWA